MATNRLYLVDTNTKDSFLLASTQGCDWSLSFTIESLQEWLEKRDEAATMGEPYTNLSLFTENLIGDKGNMTKDEEPVYELVDGEVVMVQNNIDIHVTKILKDRIHRYYCLAKLPVEKWSRITD